MYDPDSVARMLGERIKQERLAINLTQDGLAKRAGIGLSTLKQFEHTGKISLQGLLQLALVLERLDDFIAVLQPKGAEYTTLDDLLRDPPTRKRGRKA